MTQISYKVGDLKKLIRESSEWQPKVGAGVTKTNASNNEKSYKDAEKAAKDFDGGLKPQAKGKLPSKPDTNRTTLDYNPQGEVTKEYKDRIDAQAKGYTSKLEEDNGIAKAAEFDNDGKIKKQFTDAAKERNDAKEKLAHSGINGQNLPKEKKETMFENKTPKAKRLTFKHTKFINEGQMLSRIPEEYKVDGQKIYMKDSADNEYLVECVKSEKSGLVETIITNYVNKKKIDEQMERINQLFNYEHEKPYASRSNEERINENATFGEMMNIARGLIK